MHKPLFILIVLILLPCVLLGQSTLASLTGRVTDPDRKVIGAATIRAINTGTGIQYQGLTSEAGVYYVSDLPPGRYRIEVEKVGFKAVIESDVFLHVQDVMEVNFEMMLGSTSESVTVRDNSAPRDTESSSVGTVVERREANELPLNGRNVFNLIVLAPSVIPQGSSSGTPVGVNPFGWGNYQVTGAFGNQSAEYLDGQPLNISYINLPILVPIQDSIQEFKVQTSNLPAEWGRFAGGVTNLSTRGGTHTIHGGAYEYLRNRIFNANDYFLNAAGKPRPAWVENQFGAEAGGPLRLPACCVQNRIVWFMNWEGFALRTGEPFTATVPTAEEKTGDFSAISSPVFDPCAGSALNAQGACPMSESMPAQFQGNKIPVDRINPTSKALLYLWPKPNVPGTVTPSGTFNNFNAVANTGGNQNQAVARVDQELTDKQKLFARLNYWDVFDLPIDPLNNGLCEDRCFEHYRTFALAQGYNYAISSQTVFDLNSSFSYFRYRRYPKNAGFDLASIGWPSSYNEAIPSAMRTPPTPCVATYVDNIMCTQGQSFIQDNDYQYNLSPGLTLIRHRHLFHLGAQFEVSYDNFAQTNVASGAFDFCGFGEPCYTGLSIADFLLGYADNFSNVENHFSAQAVVPEVTEGKQVYRALYLNDTWHVANNLALNLGLRYELQGPWSERLNRLSYFDPSAMSYTNAFLPAGSTPVRGDVFLVSPGTRNNLPLRKDNFAPRLGIAYGVTPKTMVRGGYGIFWIPNYVAYALNPNNDMVNAASTTFTGTVDGIHPYSSISLPFPNGISPPPGRRLGTEGTQQFLTQVVQSITEVDRDDHPEGYVQQWSVSLDHQLPAQFSFVAAYVGSKGTHLAQYSQQVNQISDNLLSQAAAQFASGGRSAVELLKSTPNPFTVNGQALALTAASTTVGQLLRPYPQYTSVELAGQGSFDSIYHSFQLTATKRFSAGSTLTAAYTNSKLISNTDTLTGWLETRVGAIQDNNDLQRERSLSSQDVPQRLAISYVLDLPFGEGRPYFSHLNGIVNGIVGDWGIDGVATFQRGFPLVFTNGQTNDATLFGAGSRPNISPSCAKSRTSSSRLQSWFNTNCFYAPADFTFGSEPRVDATLRSDGVNNIDFAAFKRILLDQRDHLAMEFRVEFFNLLNRVQFAPPDTTCCVGNNPDFGVVTSTAPGTNPRLIQFAARLSF
ncbi:carboxypeptidase-like regulatory domain-containing protein [Acidicapsa acidisoli]|uniref:carboxypeptidase-like regulatory domain-containing protein n=1 Tax=Acidicapsa acidisoli TaxID=1615681 RepID=UPI0021DFABBE|nr:carboxypeptidase-like regulatory domain-containing protein [Acidicapsa acidisoli]